MSGRARRRAPFWLLLVMLLLACGVGVVISLAFGSESIPVRQAVDVLAGRLSGNRVTGPNDVIVWDLRTPRALLAVIVGAGLALAGVGMQTLVRNPLADPYLLGISAGASVGATAVITFGVFESAGIYAVSFGALLGAMGSALLVYAVTLSQGGITPLRLVLSGVVLSAALSSAASFMVFLSDDNRAANSVMFWMLGSVGGATWERLVPPLAVVIAAGVLAMLAHSWLDALAAGPDTAVSLGVNVGALRTAVFIVLGVLIGTLVAMSGGIGFVGLIVPHAARMLVGACHRVVIPVAMAGGGVFLLAVDVFSRLAARPQEIPLGVVTGLIGAPAFLFLMGRSRYQFGGSR